MKSPYIAVLVFCVLANIGCHANKKPCISAVSLNRDCHWGQETGIPFYLPKPLMIVAKNFRYIEEAKVGLTDTAPIPAAFDDQSKYADLNARTNFDFEGSQQGEAGTYGGVQGPAEKSEPRTYSENGAPITPLQSPSDGLGPDTFFTYHIVFVPDLTQKYGLRIRGGPGEIRAAMNLVNGWQYTGMGPYYSKDSSSAQNILAGGISARLGGQAARDVVESVADLAKAFPAGATESAGFDAGDPRVQRLSETITQLPVNASPMFIPDYAEIHVYEPSLGPDGMMHWNEIAACNFNRAYIGVKRTEKEYRVPEVTQVETGDTESAGFVGDTSDSVSKTAIAAVFGISPDSAAIQATGATESGGFSNGVPAGGVNQVNVTCPEGCQKPCCERPSRHFSLINFGGCRDKQPPKIERRVVTVTPTPVAVGVTNNDSVNQGVSQRLRQQNNTVGGALESGGFSAADNDGAVFNNSKFNQPIINQPVFEPLDAVPIDELP